MSQGKEQEKQEPLTEAQQKEKDTILAGLRIARKEMREKVHLKAPDEIFAFYWTLSLEYNRNKDEYNRKKHGVTRKQLNDQYMSLVYKQGCLKAFEHALSLSPEEIKDFDDAKENAEKEAKLKKETVILEGGAPSKEGTEPDVKKDT